MNDNRKPVLVAVVLGKLLSGRLWFLFFPRPSSAPTPYLLRGRCRYDRKFSTAILIPAGLSGLPQSSLRYATPQSFRGSLCVRCVCARAIAGVRAMRWYGMVRTPVNGWGSLCVMYKSQDRFDDLRVGLYLCQIQRLYVVFYERRQIPSHGIRRQTIRSVFRTPRLLPRRACLVHPLQQLCLPLHPRRAHQCVRHTFSHDAI